MSTLPAASRRLAAGLVVLIAAAFVVPLWVAKYPPFVDLPQHAAQLSIWRHLERMRIGHSNRLFELRATRKPDQSGSVDG